MFIKFFAGHPVEGDYRVQLTQIQKAGAPIEEAAFVYQRGEWRRDDKLKNVKRVPVPCGPLMAANYFAQYPTHFVAICEDLLDVGRLQGSQQLATGFYGDVLKQYGPYFKDAQVFIEQRQGSSFAQRVIEVIKPFAKKIFLAPRASEITGVSGKPQLVDLFGWYSHSREKCLPRIEYIPIKVKTHEVKELPPRAEQV